jgi:hypothetical protein
MQFRSLLIGAAFAALSVTAASADIRIQNDPGGLIYNHMNAFARVRDAGENVIIDGRCYSACTLVLGIVPRDRICVTSRATLGFHAAWIPGQDGRPIRSEEGTSAMWTIYPDNVRRWIRSKGGLTSKVVILRGRELTSMYRLCP